jgi:hypothetical protein
MNNISAFLFISLVSTLTIYATEDATCTNSGTYTIQQFRVSELSESIQFASIIFPGTDIHFPEIVTQKNKQEYRRLPFRYCITESENLIHDLRVERKWRPLQEADLNILVHEAKHKAPQDCVTQNIFNSLNENAYPHGTYVMDISIDSLGQKPSAQVSYRASKTPPEATFSK